MASALVREEMPHADAAQETVPVGERLNLRVIWTRIATLLIQMVFTFLSSYFIVVSIFAIFSFLILLIEHFKNVLFF